jgi:hypothetical protein
LLQTSRQYGIDVHELALGCAPDAGSIDYRVERLNAFDAEGMFSTDLPANTALPPQIWIYDGPRRPPCRLM